MTPAVLPLLQAIALPVLAETVEVPVVAEAPADLNPFGAVFLALSWVLLLSLNAWCFTKVLGGDRRRTGPTLQEAL